MRTLLASLVLLTLGACAILPASTLSGIYLHGANLEAFYSHQGGDPYSVSASPEARAALDAALPENQADARLVVEIEGVLSMPGAYGPHGEYSREIYITRVISARPLSPSGY